MNKEAYEILNQGIDKTASKMSDMMDREDDDKIRFMRDKLKPGLRRLPINMAGSMGGALIGNAVGGQAGAALGATAGALGTSIAQRQKAFKELSQHQFGDDGDVSDKNKMHATSIGNSAISLIPGANLATFYTSGLNTPEVLMQKRKQREAMYDKTASDVVESTFDKIANTYTPEEKAEMKMHRKALGNINMDNDLGYKQKVMNSLKQNGATLGGSVAGTAIGYGLGKLTKGKIDPSTAAIIGMSAGTMAGYPVMKKQVDARLDRTKEYLENAGLTADEYQNEKGKLKRLTTFGMAKDIINANREQ